MNVIVVYVPVFYHSFVDILHFVCCIPGRIQVGQVPLASPLLEGDFRGLDWGQLRHSGVETIVISST